MPLHLHGSEATQATTLQELFGDIKAADAKNGADASKRDFFPIAFSGPKAAEAAEVEHGEDITAIFAEIVGRIQMCFQGSMMLFRDKKDGEPLFRRYFPLDSDVKQFFDREDLHAVQGNVLSYLMPGADEHFSAAVSHRRIGILKLLADVINFIDRYKLPRLGFKFLQKTLADVQMPDGTFKKLHDVPWELDEEDKQAATNDGLWPENMPDRVTLLTRRSREMERADYMLRNRKLTTEIRETFGEQVEIFDKLDAAFGKAAGRLKVSAYNAARWCYVLLNALSKVTPTSSGITEKTPFIDALITEIDQAQTSEQLSTAIDKYVPIISV